MNTPEWAINLTNKKIARKEFAENAHDLYEKTLKFCKDNLKRNKMSSKDGPEEMKRLVEILQKEDDMKQLEYDYKIKKGVIVESDYNQPGKIEAVQLNLEDSELIDILNEDGESLPACCMKCNRIRDIVQKACRNDKFIEIEELEEAAILIESHDFDEPVLNTIASLWQLVKKDAKIPNAINNAENINTPEGAMNILEKCIGTINWHKIISKPTDEETKFKQSADNHYARAMLKTAIKTLNKEIDKLDIGTIYGYAVVDEKGNVGVNHCGIAMFKTKKMAKIICDSWNKQEPRFLVKKAVINSESFLILPDNYKIEN